MKKKKKNVSNEKFRIAIASMLVLLVLLVGALGIKIFLPYSENTILNKITYNVTDNSDAFSSSKWSVKPSHALDTFNQYTYFQMGDDGRVIVDDKTDDLDYKAEPNLDQSYAPDENECTGGAVISADEYRRWCNAARINDTYSDDSVNYAVVNIPTVGLTDQEQFGFRVLCADIGYVEFGISNKIAKGNNGVHIYFELCSPDEADVATICEQGDTIALVIPTTADVGTIVEALNSVYISTEKTGL